MTDAISLWSVWQSLLSSFAWAFTRPGFRRFRRVVTALAINSEEHTFTQSVLAIERPPTGRRWRPSPSPAPGGPTPSPAA